MNYNLINWSRRKGKTRVTVWHKATAQNELGRGVVEVTDDGLSIVEAYPFFGVGFFVESN